LNQCNTTEDESLVLEDNFKCKACPSSTSLALVLTFAFLGFSVLVVIMVSRKRNSQQRPHAVWFKIVFSGFQANAVASTMFNWTEYTDRFLFLQQSLSSFGVAYFNPACLFPRRNSIFVFKSAIYALAPVVLVGLALLCSWLRLMCSTKSSDAADARLPSWKQASIGLAVVLMFFLQPILTFQTAAFFSCVQLGQNKFFLAGDLTIECYTRSHIRLLLYLALPMGLFYVIGVPLAILLILVRNKTLLFRVSHAARLGVTQHTDTIPSEQCGYFSPTTGTNSSSSRSDGKSKPCEDDSASPYYEYDRAQLPVLTVEEVDFQYNYAFLFLGFRDVSYFWVQ
jgi:hypothetical protein